VLAAASGLVGVPIRLEEASGADALLVKESETVAVALILNELVTNAVKHGLRHRPGPAPRVQLLRDGACGRIRITNAGRLPPGFDFDAGQGLGTGLGLVRALMPAQGMSIRFGMNGPEVEAVITVEAPVLVEDATRSGALLV
jgi:two-component sensor histidine kinase